MCVCVCVCVWFACLCTHRILPDTYTDTHHLPLPCIRCCHSHNSAVPLPHPFRSHPVSPPTIFLFLSPSLILPPSCMCQPAAKGKRKERRKLLQFSPALSLPPYTLTMTGVHALESQRGKTLQVNACDLSEQNSCTLPQH